MSPRYACQDLSNRSRRAFRPRPNLPARVLHGSLLRSEVILDDLHDPSEVGIEQKLAWNDFPSEMYLPVRLSRTPPLASLSVLDVAEGGWKLIGHESSPTRNLIRCSFSRSQITTVLGGCQRPGMPSLRRQFGNRLKAIRTQRKLTQEQFAELIGISVDFLSLIERGINAPSFDVLENMARRLKVTVRELFDFR